MGCARANRQAMRTASSDSSAPPPYRANEARCTTSTVSNELTHDLGGDPNELVSIHITAASTSANTSFTVLETAAAGERLGGVAVAPVPEPQTYALMLGGLIAIGALARRRRV